MSDKPASEETEAPKESTKKSFLNPIWAIALCVIIGLLVWGINWHKSKNRTSDKQDRTEMTRSHNAAVSEVVEIDHEWSTLVHLPYDLHITAKTSTIDSPKVIEVKMTRPDGTVAQWIEYPGATSGRSLAPGALLEARTINESDFATVWVVCQ